MDKTFVFNKNNICTNPNTPISWISEESKFQKEMLSEIRKGINLYDIRQLELFD